MGKSREDFFTTNPHDRDLKRKSVRGAAATIGGQIGKLALRTGSTAILARLLTPQDYGLVAMTAVVVNFVGIFKDAGLSQATIQRDTITHQQVSNLFWLNAGLGCAIALVVVAISPLIASFYGDPRLVGISCALACSFVLTGLTVQHQALMRRKLRFATLARIEVSSMAVGIATAIVMASLGCGYWSLIGMTLGSAASNLISVWTGVKWIPGRPRRNAASLEMIRFGGDLLGFNLVNYFSRQSDTILIGWKWGAMSLALYDKAYQMLLLPIRQVNGPVAAVVVPVLSRVKNDPARFSRYFCFLLQVTGSATIPLIGGLALFADEFVLLWLGAKWQASAEIFRLLAPAAVVGAICNPAGPLLIPLGMTRRYRDTGVVMAVIAVASFLIGLPYGARGVAISYSASRLLTVGPYWFLVARGTPVRPTAIWAAFLPCFAAFVPAGLLGYGIQHWLPTPWSPNTMAVLAAMSYLGSYAFLLLVVFRRHKIFSTIWMELKKKPAATATSTQPIGVDTAQAS